jgi:hypothetical protein
MSPRAIGPGFFVPRRRHLRKPLIAMSESVQSRVVMGGGDSTTGRVGRPGPACPACSARPDWLPTSPAMTPATRCGSPAASRHLRARWRRDGSAASPRWPRRRIRLARLADPADGQPGTAVAEIIDVTDGRFADTDPVFTLDGRHRRQGRRRAGRRRRSRGERRPGRHRGAHRSRAGTRGPLHRAARRDRRARLAAHEPHADGDLGKLGADLSRDALRGPGHRRPRHRRLVSGA